MVATVPAVKGASSNTPPLDTSQTSKLWATRPPLPYTAHCDWLSFSWPGERRSWLGVEVAPIGDESEWAMLERGNLGYKLGYEHVSGARWYGDGAGEGMGCHMVMSGRAMAWYANKHGDPFGTQLIRMWAALGGVVTRYDFAADVTDGSMTVQELLLADARGLLTKRSQSPVAWQGGGKGGGGGTATWGSRSSDLYVRAYDKGAEQAAKGAHGGGDGAVAAPWFRLEYEIKGDVARRLTEELAAGNYGAVANLCSRSLCLREEGSDTNRSRWPVDPRWTRLLGQPTPYTPARPDPTGTIDQRAVWLEHQAGRVLATLQEAWGWEYFGAELERMVRDSRERMRDDDARAVAEYRNYPRSTEGRG